MAQRGGRGILGPLGPLSSGWPSAHAVSPAPTNMARSSALLLLAALTLPACDSNEAPRRAGVCYCEFYSGDESEYDLSDMDREAQVAQCRVHDTNAQNFGGRCELE